MLNFTIQTLLLQIPAAFFALALREAVKARCSTALGDPSPKNAGLLVGNPFKYIEPIGFIFTVVFDFGWGRPTPTSPLYYKDPKKGILITYLTPSVVNLFVGLFVAFFVGIVNLTAVQMTLVAIHPIFSFAAYWTLLFLAAFARINVSLALFNMIPVPPLDAAKLLQSAVSPNVAVKLTQNEKVLQLVMMMLIIMNVIPMIIRPIALMLVNAAWSW